jgi:hypothetical protein
VPLRPDHFQRVGTVAQQQRAVGEPGVRVVGADLDGDLPTDPLRPADPPDDDPGVRPGDD